MEQRRNQKIISKTCLAWCAGVAASAGVAVHSDAAQSSVATLLDNLQQNGVLTTDKANVLKSEFAAEMAAERTNIIAELRAEFATQTAIERTNLASQLKAQIEAEMIAERSNIVNQLPASKWKLPDSIKDIELFGDLRMRYERRAVENPTPKYKVGYPTSGTTGQTYDRERFRYALRVGIRGDLYDDFNFGLRLETSANPRSPWVTFADDTGKSSGSPLGGSPSDKSNDGIYVGQAYIGWRPTSWFEMTVGRMPQPLYTSPMVWDSDINPEGAFEKFKGSIGPVDLFADFGQFDYQNRPVGQEAPTSDTFLLAWQAGTVVHITKNISVKVAPVLYNYVGRGNGPLIGADPTSAAVINSIYGNFVGQGDFMGQIKGSGFNGLYNQAGIDNLCVLEIPAEFKFIISKTPLGDLQTRIFGDYAYNFEGNDRSRAAFKTGGPLAFPGVKKAILGQNNAFQAGVAVGSAGPEYGPTKGFVYGSAAKKHSWEARVYWQYIEQYALDVNLIDSDFFEGRANLRGTYVSFAYCFSDAIIGTIRYGYASRIRRDLGTGGNNYDIPGINPINNFDLVQCDLTWLF